MREDPFIAFCEELKIDYFRAAGIIHKNKTYQGVAKSLDIKERQAEKLCELYWSLYNES